MTFGMGENETEIDLVLTKKEHQLSMRNLKAILGEFHYSLVVADIDKRKIKKVV